MAALLADLILAVHFAFVAFMLFGLLTIPLGGLLGWRWVREPWWRWAHLLGMGIVALQALLQEPCFLTVWEADLRASTGAWADERSFVVRLMNDLLFIDVTQADQRLLWGIYVVLFVLVLVSLALVRPRRHPWFGRGRPEPALARTGPGDEKRD